MAIIFVGYSVFLSNKDDTYSFRYNHAKKMPCILICPDFRWEDKTSEKIILGKLRTCIEEDKGVIFYHESHSEKIIEVFKIASERESVFYKLNNSNDESAFNKWEELLEDTFDVVRINVDSFKKYIREGENMIEEIIKQEIDKYENDIYAYVLCKDNEGTDYRKLAPISVNHNDFINGLILYKLVADGLIERHIMLKKKNQHISTMMFEYIEENQRIIKNVGIFMSLFSNNYTLIICYDENIRSGVLASIISTISTKIAGKGGQR